MSDEPTEPVVSPEDALHPRDLACQQAGKELITFINEWKFKHSLTSPEFLHIMLMPISAYIRQLGVVEREALLRGVK